MWPTAPELNSTGRTGPHDSALYLLRGAVEALRRLQDVLPTLQLSRLPVADVAQLLLQRLQLHHVVLLACTEQGGDLLVQLHVDGEPLLQGLLMVILLLYFF